MNISVNGIDAWIGAGVDFLERQFGLSVNPIIAERIIVLGLAISLVVTLLNFHSEARYWMKVFFRTFRSLRLWSGLTIRQKLLVFLNTSESIVTIGLIFYIIK